jgi:hypothetical protein
VSWARALTSTYCISVCSDSYSPSATPGRVAGGSLLNLRAGGLKRGVHVALHAQTPGAQLE